MGVRGGHRVIGSIDLAEVFYGELFYLCFVSHGVTRDVFNTSFWCSNFLEPRKKSQSIRFPSKKTFREIDVQSRQIWQIFL